MDVRGLRVDEYQEAPLIFQRKFLPTVSGSHTWGRRGVWDDGSCFYHTVAAITNYQDYHKKSKRQKQAIGRELRQAVRRCLSEKAWRAILREHHLEAGAPPFQTLCSEMAGFRTWANYWTILFTFHMLHLNVIFYDMDNNGFPYCGITGLIPTKVDPRSLAPEAAALPDMRWRVCGIYWVQHMHFEPLVLNQTEYHWDPASPIGRGLIDRYMRFGSCGSGAPKFGQGEHHEEDEYTTGVITPSAATEVNHYIRLLSHPIHPLTPVWQTHPLFGGIL